MKPKSINLSKHVKIEQIGITKNFTVHLVIGNQSFQIEGRHDKEHAMFYRRMLKSALTTLINAHSR